MRLPPDPGNHSEGCYLRGWVPGKMGFPESWDNCTTSQRHKCTQRTWNQEGLKYKQKLGFCLLSSLKLTFIAFVSCSVWFNGLALSTISKGSDGQGLSGFIQWFRLRVVIIKGQNGIPSDCWGTLGSLEYIIQKFDLLVWLESYDSIWILTLSNRISTTHKVPLCGLERGVWSTDWGKPHARAQSLLSRVQAGFQSPVIVLGGHLCVVSTLQNHTG